MRIRLFLSFTLVILISLVGVALFIRQGAQNELQTFLGRGGLIGAESLVADLEDYFIKNGSWDGVEKVMPHSGGQGQTGENTGRISGYGKLAAMRLTDADYRLVYEPENNGLLGTTIQDPEASIPIVVAEKEVGHLIPQEGYAQENQQFEDQFIDRINRASVNAAVVSGAAALLLAFILAYFLFRPLQSLTAAARRLSSGDFSHRVDIDRPQEFARLGNTFNHMAASLETMDRRRKDLTADIAHELRTPLAVQRAHLEAMLDGVYPLSEDNITTVLTHNELLAHLVEDLRVLSLADAGELKLYPKEIDMQTLISVVVEQFKARAGVKKIAIQLNMPKCPPIYADPDRIQQILHNLFQNGIRYTPEGGSIDLALSCEGADVVFVIHNSGTNIPEADLPHIFERFFRTEKSRSKESGGTGLGLAIAHGLVEAHGGRLTARNHPFGGAEFTLTLPRCGPGTSKST